MKVRKVGIFTQLFIWLAILLLAGNAVLGYMAYTRSEASLFGQIQSNAKNVAQCAAMSVTGEVLQTIDVGEEGSAEYQQIIDELAVFRDNADIEYIYTLKKNGEESYTFVVDSDPEEPGAIGDECEMTQAMADAFTEKITTVDDEPFTDEWGSHVSAYSPIFMGDNVIGAIGVDISANWIDEQMENLRNLVILTCIITYAISLAVLLLLMMKFRRGMNKLNNKVKELANGSGDLTKEIDIRSGDELEVIAGNMNMFIRQIRTLVEEVVQSADEIVSSGEKMNTTVSSNTRIMSGMNSELESISVNMQESARSSKELSQQLSESAEEIVAFAENVNQICTMIEKANESAQTSSATAVENQKNTLNSIHSMQTRMQKAEQDVEKITQVKQIAEEISNIASQTRILSINAQIEAARAGQAGAGFAIVATEVGTLSNEIDRAATEINNINNEIISAVETLTTVLNEMITFVSTDVAKDYDSFAALGEEYGSTTSTIRTQMSAIGKQSASISRTISDINASVKEITHNVAVVSDSAGKLTKSTRQITESMDGMKSAAQHNSEHSRQLSSQVSKYSI
ncbi:MAG: methyl-accepting chemotaxis protein [Ruminococcus sp.]|nr:methyl-accepting chemotaxis protein [Ruminococcus sp.]MBQ7008794.1 methyl-accepting chemotaxis protein [Ruminococcus sp.]